MITVRAHTHKVPNNQEFFVAIPVKKGHAFLVENTEHGENTSRLLLRGLHKVRSSRSEPKALRRIPLGEGTAEEPVEVLALAARQGRK